MNIINVAKEIKMDLLYVKYKALWELSVRLKKPVYSWAWRSIVYRKQYREALWNAYCKDISNMF